MRVTRLTCLSASSRITVVRIASHKPLQKNLLPGNEASGSYVQNITNVPQASGSPRVSYDSFLAKR